MNKKIIFSLMILSTIALLTITSVSANEMTNETVDLISNDDNQEVIDLADSKNIVSSNANEYKEELDTLSSESNDSLLKEIENCEKISQSEKIPTLSGVEVKMDSYNVTYGSHSYINFSYSGYDDNYACFIKVYKVYQTYESLIDYYFPVLWNSENTSFDCYGLDVGKYLIKITQEYWDNNAIGGWTNPHQIYSGYFNIIKTSSSISAKSISIYYGQSIFIYANVNKPYFASNEYNEGSVVFKINGKEYSANIINGVAKLKFNNNLDIKTYDCSVSYNGNDQINPSSNMFKITVKKTNTLTKTNSIKSYPKSKSKLKIYVKDKFGNKINGKVKVKINGKIYYAQAKNGLAKISFTTPKKVKTYKASAQFLGDGHYISSSCKFKMIIKKAPVKKKTTKKTTEKKTTKKTTKKKTTKKKKSSKYKIINSKAKFYWVYKKSGKFLVSTKIWDMTAGFMAPCKYVDTFLYKNGKLLAQSKYKVKMKLNGKWTKWRTAGPGTNHHRYAVYDSVNVGGIKVKVHK